MTDHWIEFDSVFPPLITLSLLLITGAVLVWEESKRKHAFLPARIMAQVIMILALAGILLRPSYKTSVSTEILLLTSGYSKKAADSIRQTNPSLQFVRTPNSLPYKDSDRMDSYHALTRFGNDVKFILGEGIPGYAKELFDRPEYVFLPAGYPSGIIQLSLPDRIIKNRKNKIEGQFNSNSGTTVYLEGPGGKEDSITLTGKKLSFFNLHFTPKQSGQFVYTITIRDSTGGEEKNLLPVNVEEEQSFNILLIQYYPTFETQYLKTFLSKSHRLVLRYQLSRNTFRYEYINRSPQRLENLTPGKLSPFDLLFMDSETFRRLPSDEIRAIQESVQSGLGVILLFNENPAKVSRLTSILPLNFKSTPADTVNLNIHNKTISLPAWPVTPEPSPSLFPILQNKQRIMSGYVYSGMGKMGFHLPQESFRLSLQGDSLAYGELWSNTIEQIARGSYKHNTIRIKNAFPVYPEVPVSVEVISRGGEPTLLHNGIRISLKEDLIVDNVWHGTAWSSEPGWHTLVIPDDSTTFSYYVSGKDEWLALSKANMINQTGGIETSKHEAGKLQKKSKLIPPLLFYILLIMSAGFIWVAPKL